jgi:hypothetical protein
MPTRPTTLSSTPVTSREQRPGALTARPMMRARAALVRRACVFSLLQLTHMTAVQELSDGPACGNVTPTPLRNGYELEG